MLPGGFKKDSRVWLHKNAATFPKKGLPLSNCDCDGQRIGSDDPYHCLPQDQHNRLQPIITDASGRIYKKDSRTWLHKSSKKKMKSSKGGDLMEDIGNRMGWRQEACGLSGGEGHEDVIRTRSSTELIRVQTGVNKIKKKKTMMLMSMMMTPPPMTAKRASYHDMSSAGKDGTPVSAFSSDLCIACKERCPPRPALQENRLDSDNNDCDNDNDDDEEMEDVGARGRQRLIADVTGQSKPGRRGVWNHSTVEVTKDGLRELEQMMKEQNQRRSARLDKPLLDRPAQTPGCDVSPQSLSSDSRVSLDANINLSDEIMYEGGLNQSQNSAEQLTQATEYLHVCSPDRQAARR